MMRNFTLVFALLAAFSVSYGYSSQNVSEDHGSLKGLEVSDAILADLVKSCKIIESIEDVSAEQVDSVISTIDNLKYIPKADLAVLHQLMIPQLVSPAIPDHIQQFETCSVLSKKYMKQIAGSIPVMIQKYKKGDEATLAENLEHFFQLYLYVGLSSNDKLSSLQDLDPESILTSDLEKLLLEARGSMADDAIYFVMSHSTMPLFDLMTPMLEKYKIPATESNNE